MPKRSDVRYNYVMLSGVVTESKYERCYNKTPFDKLRNHPSTRRWLAQGDHRLVLKVTCVGWAPAPSG